MGNCKKCPFYKTEPVPEDLVGAELLERRWIPVNENLYPGTPDRAGDGSGCNPFTRPPTFSISPLPEPPEVENAETK